MDDKEYIVEIKNYVDNHDEFFEGPGLNDTRYELDCDYTVGKVEMNRIVYLVMNDDDYKNYHISFWRNK